jgi:hypothetical protein
MGKTGIFEILLLIARPAAGKSEIIDYLKKTSIEERISRFHVGDYKEIDDFPMLWTWFEEDYILERMSHPRLHTDPEGYFLHPYMWNLLIERICLDYSKILRDTRDEEPFTTIIEFSRGSEHGGYAGALSHLSLEVVEKMSILYLDVSWEESLRKNRKRFNPDRPDSILEHGIEDAKLERMYKEVDWTEISAASPEFITLQGVNVPYAVFENEDDVTSGPGEELGDRLEETLERLWRLKTA